MSEGEEEGGRKEGRGRTSLNRLYNGLIKREGGGGGRLSLCVNMYVYVCRAVEGGCVRLGKERGKEREKKKKRCVFEILRKWLFEETSTAAGKESPSRKRSA